MNRATDSLRTSLATGLVLAMLVAPASAQESWTTQRVHFAAGQSTTTMQGTLRGHRTADYVVNARAGQVLSVHLDSRNASATFDVVIPGSRDALILGTEGRTTFTGTLASAGTAAVRVYLLRGAARLDEAADYALTIALTDPAPEAREQTPGAVSPKPR